jgi:molecular chaperone DnaJ
MGNPYEILGVKESATDEEVKAAYKVLVKKYHPDRHANNPLEDLAEEKLRQVNQAYDEITDIRKGKTSSTYGGSSSSGGYGAYGGRRNTVSPEFAEVRRDIDANRLNEAAAKLQRVQTRTAEWIFLDGMISYRKGWYDDAISKIQQAVYMDPQNAEYNQALNGLRNSGQGYRNTAYGRGYRSNDDMLCTACQLYLCADCCCDCI